MYFYFVVVVVLAVVVVSALIFRFIFCTPFVVASLFLTNATNKVTLQPVFGIIDIKSLNNLNIC